MPADSTYEEAAPSTEGSHHALSLIRNYLSSELGPLSLNPILALITPLFGGKKIMFPIPRDEPEMVRYLKELIESGAFRPLVDRRYPLDQIADAYRYVETGRKIGNVVISVDLT